jgi:hypothetical protein
VNVSAQGAKPQHARGSGDARFLLFVPVAAGLVFGVLLLPRSAVPHGIPLPDVNARALARTAATDRELADRAKAQPLPGSVRALGSALRKYHSLEHDLAQGPDLAEARRVVDVEFASAVGEGDGPLLALRAVQVEGFLDETARFESTGLESDELGALAGGFVRSMRNEGWCQGNRLAPDPPVLRAMFKEMWNAFLGLEQSPAFALTLDERRATFSFTMVHAHPPAKAREQVEALRRGARDAKDCAAADVVERKAVARWQIDRIARLAAVDPTYPASFARGVASYAAGSFEVSADAFRDWLQEHPSGPLTLRAQAFLRAAVLAARID